MKDKLKELIDVKSIVTFTITFGLTWGFITGNLTSGEFMGVAGSVFTYYFTRKMSEGDTDE